MTRDDEFRAWVRDNRGRLLRTATLLTAGDGHTAEDVVQNTLTRVYVAWSRVRRAENPSAYVRRALVNAFTDEMRSTRRRREDLRGEMPDGSVPLGATDPDTLLLYDALRELPDRMRAAVVLRYFQDLSVEETARSLRCTQGTVKSQTARALDKLRTRLGPLLREEPADGAAPLPRTVPSPALTPAPAPWSAS